ncbi:MAG: hypothetical protein AAGA03_06705, partial [Planctomycetota bacterium]
LKQQRGLLLQHPQLGRRSEDDVLPHLDKDLVNRLLDLRQTRLRDDRMMVSDHTQTVVQIPDPIDARKTMIALEPVVVRGRPAQIADTGWIVASVSSQANSPQRDESDD